MPNFTPEDYLIMKFIAVGVGIYALSKILEIVIDRSIDKQIVKREKEKKLWK